MRWALRVYKEAFKNEFSAMAAYRADFLFRTVLLLLGELVMPFVTMTIYNSGASFPGWSMYEVLLLQSIYMMCMGIADCLFFGIINTTRSAIVDGTYDLIMLRPGSSAVILTAMSVNLDSIGSVLSGLMIFVYSVNHLPKTDVVQWVGFSIFFIMGCAVLLGLSLFMAGLCFKWVGNGRVYEMFTSIARFGFYPVDIFPKLMQRILIYILPVTMLGFFPALTILGKVSSFVLIPCIACCIFMMSGLYFYKVMQFRYTSAGG